jgi:hypothetical protein
MKQLLYDGARLLGVGLVLCALTGCSGNRSQLDILPSQDKARGALEKALTAWQSGQKMGKIQGDSEGIEIIDRVWKKGQKLASFEILQAMEKPHGEGQPGPRWFSVRLTLKGSQPQQVNYAVLGLDPLWVYREEDYNQACGMGNN